MCSPGFLLFVWSNTKEQKKEGNSFKPINTLYTLFFHQTFSNPHLFTCCFSTYLPMCQFWSWLWTLLLLAEKNPGLNDNGADQRVIAVCVSSHKESLCKRYSIVCFTAFGKGQSQSASFVKGLSTDMRSVIFFFYIFVRRTQRVWILVIFDEGQPPYSDLLPEQCQFGHCETETALTVAPYQ